MRQIDAHDSIAVARQGIELRPGLRATCTRLILDDHLLAGHVLPFGLLEACRNIGLAASVERNDVGHRLGRKVLNRLGRKRRGRQQSGKDGYKSRFHDFLLTSRL